jgi:hypothetical protein
MVMTVIEEIQVGKKTVRVGDEVHFVRYRHTNLPGTEHMPCKVKAFARRNEKWIATLEVENGEMPNAVMALSREVGTWHPVGGYGCEHS